MYCAKQRGRNNLQCFEPGMDTRDARARQARERPAQRARAAAVRAALPAEGRHRDGLFPQRRGADPLAASRARHRSCRRTSSRSPRNAGSSTPSASGCCAKPAGSARRGSARACRRCASRSTSSASQFRQGNLLDVIQQAVNDAGLDPRCLELELTESAVMTNPEESARHPREAERAWACSCPSTISAPAIRA